MLCSTTVQCKRGSMHDVSQAKPKSFCMNWITEDAISILITRHQPRMWNYNRYLFRQCACLSLIPVWTETADPDKILGNLLYKHDFGSPDRDRYSPWCCCLHLGTCQSCVGVYGGGGAFCPVCDKRQLFTALHLTYSLTPRSLSPTPTSPCSPCSPLHAFHFWR